MSESVIEDKKNLKRVVAYSRDVIVFLVDRDIVFKLVPKQFAYIFTEFHETLVGAIEKDANGINDSIEDTRYDEELWKAGLLGDSLKFKYNFFNALLKIFKLPSLDEYDDDDITGYSPLDRAPVTSVAGRIKRFIKSNIKKPKFKKWIDTILAAIKNVLGSLATAFQGSSETKDFHAVRNLQIATNYFMILIMTETNPICGSQRWYLYLYF